MFFFNDPATTEIYTLSLHDALPISSRRRKRPKQCARQPPRVLCPAQRGLRPPRRKTVLARVVSPSAPASDRKSTRLNSSHSSISYAVFCLKKKKYNRIIVFDSITES